MDDGMVPRTTTDIVFDQLQEEIVSLKLLPGTKMSEAEVAARLGVSRQPVRDAFNRLANLDLLSIRPQRATRVRGFSRKNIANARFVRLSIELEVIRRAHATWNAEKDAALAANLDAQKATLAAGKIVQFHELDYVYHKMIFDFSGHGLAFDTVVKCKQQVDRICVLSLKKADEANSVFDDHLGIADALANKTSEDVEAVLRRHLGRLDNTLRDIEETHAEYFE